MRKHIILFFSALLFLSACEQSDDSRGVIQQDKMVRLLTDVHIVDGTLASQPNMDSLYTQGMGKYMYLFEQYHTDSAQFRKSVKYYAAHPDVLLKMYDAITKRIQAKIDSLNAIFAKQNEVLKKQQEAKRKKDEKLRKDSLVIKAKENILKIKKDSIDKANGVKPKEKHKKKSKKKLKKTPNKINSLP
ncbi:MAG: hypothetical protein JWR50_1351 [Mucilaginibacter sp.]|nr:hypothetical protein [Mucilaginibacter sp.]